MDTTWDALAGGTADDAAVDTAATAGVEVAEGATLAEALTTLGEVALAVVTAPETPLILIAVVAVAAIVFCASEVGETSQPCDEPDDEGPNEGGAGEGGEGDGDEGGGGDEGGDGEPPTPPEDPSQPPGPDWEWRGQQPPGCDKGSWYNPNTGESLHPDLNHPDPIGPHWDYTSPDGTASRIMPDGTMVPK
jgi:Bacterial toxin 37